MHRVEALAAFLDQDTARLPFAVAGIFAADPGHQIPTALLPDGHPIRLAIPNAAAVLRADPGLALPALGKGAIEVDGAVAERAPTRRSAVMQQRGPKGELLATHYRWPDERGFDWVVGESAKVSSREVKPAKSTTERTGHRAPMLVLTAASLAGSGVLYAIAASGYKNFEDEPVLTTGTSVDEREAYRDDLETMQARNNPLAIGCYAAGGVGLILGVVTIATW